METSLLDGDNFIFCYLFFGPFVLMHSIFSCCMEKMGIFKLVLSIQVELSIEQIFFFQIFLSFHEDTL